MNRLSVLLGKKIARKGKGRGERVSLKNITKCNQTGLGNHSYFTVYFTNRQTLEFRALFSGFTLS